MATTIPAVPLRSPDRFYIDGDWVKPSTDSAFDVVDSHSEELYFRVAEAQPADMDLAIGAARRAFDHGPWPRLTHTERGEYLRAMADRLETRADTYGQIWPRESGVVHAIRSGTVGHNAFRIDYGIGFGGFKQSGIGREGGREGLLPYLEHKTVLLDGPPPGY
jgi:acyl-CoA reductase-like NAD-dependent aldehyde dehydrogenase